MTLLADSLSLSHSLLFSLWSCLSCRSHEIRTPMNGVIAGSELLLAQSDSSSLSPEQCDLIRIIRSSGEAMLVLINDILDLSKIEAGKLELEMVPLDLRQCIDSSLEVVAQKAFAKGLALQSYVRPTVPQWIKSDEVRIKQVLFNLLSNAVKFTESGYVYVKLEVIAAPPVWAHPHGVLNSHPGTPAAATSAIGASSPFGVTTPFSLLFTRKGGTPGSTASTITASSSPPSMLTNISVNAPRVVQLLFTVADSGIGINREMQQRLFSRFSQADNINRQYGGTGLGLAICKSLVELLGGNIQLESDEHKGSTFYVYLPVEVVNENKSVSGTACSSIVQANEHELSSELLPSSDSKLLLHSSQHLVKMSVPTPEGQGYIRSLHRRLPAAAAASGSLSTTRERQHLLFHSNDTIAALLRAIMEDWKQHDQVQVISSLRPYVVLESSLGDFDCIWVDLPSCMAAGEFELLPQLYEKTRKLPTRVIALVPMGSQRQNVERYVDGCLSQPIREDQFFALANAHKPRQTEGAAAINTAKAAPVAATGVLLSETLEPANGARSSPASSEINFSPLSSAWTHPGPLSSSPTDTSPGASLVRDSLSLSHTTLDSFASLYPIRILIAEDQSINQRLITKMLTRMGYNSAQFRLTADGQSALEEIQRWNQITSSPSSNPTTLMDQGERCSGTGSDAAATTGQEFAMLASSSESHVTSRPATGVAASGSATAPLIAPPATTVAPSSDSSQAYDVVLMDLQMSVNKWQPASWCLTLEWRAESCRPVIFSSLFLSNLFMLFCC
jgi:signal transduction histidine kinase/CheY-like chemotaxis protein